MLFMHTFLVKKCFKFGAFRFTNKGVIGKKPQTGKYPEFSEPPNAETTG